MIPKMNLIEHSHLQAMDEFSLSENVFGKLSDRFELGVETK